MNNWPLRSMVARCLAGGLLVLLACLCLGHPVSAEQVFESEQQARVMAIAGKLRCAVCQNQSVAESRSGLAQDMQNVIAEKLQQGASEQDILQYFVERYGEYILLKPSASGMALLVWWAPVLVLALFALVAITYLRKNRGVHGPDPASDAPQPSVLTEQQRSRLRELRKGRP